MKTYYSIKKVVFFSFLLGLIYTCTPMDYHYKDLIELGDRVYVGKIDSAWVYAGKERLKVVWDTPSDPSLEAVRVYWNNYKDSVAYLVNADKRVDTGFVIVENLPEGLHTLYIKTFDEVGNTSLGVEVSTQTYGSIFQSDLQNRAIESVKTRSGVTTINWNEVNAETMLKTEFIYYDSIGQSKTAFVLNKDLSLILNDIDLEKEVHYRSWFIPEKLALDTFKTEYTFKHLP